MELRIHGEQAVLVDNEPGGDASAAWHTDLDEAGLGEDLSAALDEWARVAATVGNGGRGPDSKVAAMVSRRGRQLAGRVAETFDTPVRYSDPISGTSALVRPTRGHRANSIAESLIGTRPGPGDPVPWMTGTIIALFSGVVVAIAMLALASTLAAQVSGWVAAVAAAVVTAGLAPSLWLGHRQLIVRWVVLGAAAGIVFSWLGVLVLVF